MKSHSSLITQELNTLKQWARLTNIDIIFDSDLQGNGYKTLSQSVLNKKNLYFITIDDQNNVFGGFIQKPITEYDFIQDKNAFVFSLLRNNEVKNSKFSLLPLFESRAFLMFIDDYYDHALYQFGIDVYVTEIGSKCSYCNHISFDYHLEKDSLATEYPQMVTVIRLIVVEMS
ncbi:TLDc domain-containing protein [Entamoeba marina]